MREKTVFAVVEQDGHSLDLLAFEDRAVAGDYAANLQESVGPHVGVWVLQTRLVPKDEPPAPSDAEAKIYTVDDLERLRERFGVALQRIEDALDDIDFLLGGWDR